MTNFVKPDKMTRVQRCDIHACTTAISCEPAYYGLTTHSCGPVSETSRSGRSHWRSEVTFSNVMLATHENAICALVPSQSPSLRMPFVSLPVKLRLQHDDHPDPLASHAQYEQSNGTHLVMLVSSGRRLLPERSRRSATAALVSSRDSAPRSHLRWDAWFGITLCGGFSTSGLEPAV